MKIGLEIAGSDYIYILPDQNEITIGRQKRKPGQKGNDVVIRVHGNDEASRAISRNHLTLMCRFSGMFICDHSTFGTKVNGQQAMRDKKFAIDVGDRINIADVLTLTVVKLPDSYVDELDVAATTQQQKITLPSVGDCATVAPAFESPVTNNAPASSVGVMSTDVEADVGCFVRKK
ncbi:FHA domain-containing protein [Candidatus Uabimicrobium amorphum]|uniref:FHA domain-containing protein n=1 Tax=Uabimicrobium amorphum TaxID=2596890 RepID=A0A5S9IRN1_UABAM|nr:FHA domain-containing protein [Candidatus Uabimicrobium amorphum]BBM86301.1 hypothetical protein UABAM_04687 [Candidatus Uabimicrobium amorphum]